MTAEQRNSPENTRQTSRVTDELKHDASHLKDTVGLRAKEKTESRKGQAVQVAGSASSALKAAAEDMRNNPDAPDWMASALQQASRKIEGLASHVDGRSVDQLGHDISEFAQRNPGTFLAASAAAGFAAARVLRAGMDKRRHDQDSNQGASASSNNPQGWSADENIMPTEGGGFAPAYGNGQPGMGGSAQ
jgi:hypothetical protein